MKPVFEFQISHPDLDETVTTHVESKAYAGVDAMIEAVREASIEARKNVASRLVDYDSFGNDSAYLDRLDAVAEETLVVSVGLKDAPTVRYAVEGDYSDGGGDWSDWVEAANPTEAEFQAKWSMADNQGSDPKAFGDFLDTMDDIDITSVQPEPTTKDEYREALQKLLAVAKAAGLGGLEVELATKRLVDDGYMVDEPEPAAPSM